MILSYSLAHVLLSQSPRHALAQVTGETPADVSEAMDVGDVAHKLLLEGQAAIAVIDAPDWRTRAAREARDAARADGKAPILAHKWDTVQAMVAAVREQLAAITDPAGLLEPEGGIVEHSLFWEEDGVQLRATPDWLSLDHRTLVDLKTVSGSAHPAAFSRTLWDKGYHLQDALYRRAVKRTYGVDADFYFCVVETSPPYALSVIALDPEARELADQQVSAAIDLWRDCCARNHWPAYPMRPCYAEAPGWVQAAWLQRTYFQEVTR